VLAHLLGSDGAGYEHIIVPAGCTALPPTAERIEAGLTAIHMNGREVFKFATRIMVEAIRNVLGRAELGIEDIDLFIPHQANARIIEYAARELGLPPERVYMNVERYGNTSAASVPLALCEALDEGRAGAGDTLALVAFGAGLTWASAVVKLGLETPALRNRQSDRAEALATEAQGGPGASLGV
jgi:3-oxoacyl-[acyl-carrier-protein] synthase-3